MSQSKTAALFVMDFEYGDASYQFPRAFVMVLVQQPKHLHSFGDETRFLVPGSRSSANRRPKAESHCCPGVQQTHCWPISYNSPVGSTESGVPASKIKPE